MVLFRQKTLAALTRNYPFMSGCLTVADLTLFKKITGMTKETVWAEVPGGKVKVHLNELVGRTAFYLGDLDKRLTWISEKLIKPGDTVIDVGANYGIMTFLFSKLTGPLGKVHSFEPNPLIFEHLKAAIDENRRDNVLIYKMALGDTREHLNLEVPKGNLGLGSLIRTSSEESSNYDVKVSTLSQVSDKSGIEKIDFLKIDVEGFEYNVILGAIEILNKNPPPFILFEMNNFIGNAGDQDIIRFLKTYNYKFISIPRCLFKMYTEEFDESKSCSEIGNDFIAVQDVSYAQCARILNTRRAL